jgi:WhiB family redox-sensing transcriptional regulator
MKRLDAAACLHADPGLFHPAPRDHRSIAAARHICARCPVRLDCLALALTIPTAQGIWGGLTEAQRAQHHRQRRRPETGTTIT